MNKTCVAVVYGGKTAEHDISLLSAASVIRHLDRQKYDIIPIGIDRQGNWYQTPLASVDPLQNKTLVVKHADSTAFVPFDFPVDVVFPVLHGIYGEDGTVQGLFEVANVAYVGCGVLGSAVALDKDISKQLVACAGIPILAHVCLRLGEWQASKQQQLEKIQQQLQYPLFVKPARTGSSVAVNKAKTHVQLVQAIEAAFAYDEKVVIEQGADVRELEVAVLENDELGQAALTSVLGEIITSHEFYSYEAKYLDEKSLRLDIPANVPNALTEQIQTLARQAFKALDCQGMARADFFVDKHSGQVFFNELNTIPGFTHVSMYPMLWQASGLAYAELLDRLIGLALSRFRSRVSIGV